MFFFFLFVTQIKMSHNITELVLSFISILFLNYNKVCSTTATRQDFPILFFCFSIYTSNFLTFNVYLYNLDVIASSPTSQFIKSHACFEARSNKHYQEKYTECTYKHKKYLYIYLYIYIYKIHSERMGRQLCTHKAPVVNEEINQQKTSGKKAREMREKMKTRKEPNQMESMANAASV